MITIESFQLQLLDFIISIIKLMFRALWHQLSTQPGEVFCIYMQLQLPTTLCSNWPIAITINLLQIAIKIPLSSRQVKQFSTQSND